MCDISSKIALAKESIILIDDYVDEQTLTVLEHKPAEVPVLVCSKNKLFTKPSMIRRRRDFNAGFDFIETNIFKDRYILVDDTHLYMMARSLRYNQKRCFAYIKVYDIEIIQKIRKDLDICKGRTKKEYRHF
jgi:hypothetical protein